MFFGFANRGAFGQAETAAEVDLSDKMLAIWVEFAATGDPNTGNFPAWPTFDAAEHFLQLDTTAMVGTAYRAARCDLWDSL